MNESQAAPNNADAAFTRLRSQVLQRWSAFPDDLKAELDAELQDALTKANAAEREQMTVSTPVSRPRYMQLAIIARDATLDDMYQNEWAELAVSTRGVLYLIYRRRDGGDYAVEWSSATMLPSDLGESLSPAMVTALFDGDD